MREILVIGIGAGNPEHMTIEAIRALNAVDLVLIPRKGAAKADLADLRREICARYLEIPARLVEFDLPLRDAEGAYKTGVDAWHAEIAAAYGRLIAAEAGPEARIALLVWGDPSLYDSTLRILDLMAAGGLAFTRRVVPGITSLQALVAPKDGSKPYLPSIHKDPWGNEYVYVYPGQHNPGGFDLLSYGPDMVLGGGDDIGNWEASGGEK